MDLYRHDATGIAELIRNKDISMKEAFDAACDRINTVNPSLNAVIRTRFDQAEKEMAAVDPTAPFAGVPFLTKDLMAAIKGTPLGQGNPASQHYIPNQDSNLVARFRKAGLVILGQTNTPELGIMGITEPKVHGPCRNPWNTQITPGGSSGGSASAVAAGIVPMASAGDGGGSIRIPASCCGLFGLKPSRGRQPMGPYISEGWGGAVSEHVLTRSVRDSAAMLDFTNGMDTGSPLPIPQVDGFLAATQQPGKPLRIGVSTASPIGSAVDDDCTKAVDHTVKLLESLGHQVERITLPIDGERLASAYLTIIMGQVAANVKMLAETLNVPVSRLNIELPTEALYRIGKSISAPKYLIAQTYWNTLSRAMGELHENIDVLLTPTLAAPPQPVGSLYPSSMEQLSMRFLRIPGVSTIAMKTGLVEQMASDMFEKMPFTQIANLTGQPSMSVPLYWNDEGLPIGVQFTAAMGDEKCLFNLAAQLEQAQPWADRWPG